MGSGYSNNDLIVKIMIKINNTTFTNVNILEFSYDEISTIYNFILPYKEQEFTSGYIYDVNYYPCTLLNYYINFDRINKNNIELFLQTEGSNYNNNNNFADNKVIIKFKPGNVYNTIGDVSTDFDYEYSLFNNEVVAFY